MTPEEHDQLRVAASNWCSRDGSQASGKQCGDELLFWLDAHPPVPSVPVSDLRAWQSNGWVTSELVALIRMAEPKPSLPPNPHQQGTYLWAREEHARRQTVKTGWRRVEGGETRMLVSADDDWSKVKFDHTDFTATDWEVVK